MRDALRRIPSAIANQRDHQVEAGRVGIGGEGQLDLT